MQKDARDSQAHEGTYSIDLEVTQLALSVCQQQAASVQAPSLTKCVTPLGLLCSTSVGVWGAAEGDPLLLGAPFVVALLTVLRKRKRKAFSNSRSCPSAPGNNRSRGRRPAWPILAWLSVSGGGTSPLSAVPFRAGSALY